MSSESMDLLKVRKDKRLPCNKVLPLPYAWTKLHSILFQVQYNFSPSKQPVELHQVIITGSETKVALQETCSFQMEMETVQAFSVSTKGKAKSDQLNLQQETFGLCIRKHFLTVNPIWHRSWNTFYLRQFFFCILIHYCNWTVSELFQVTVHIILLFRNNKHILYFMLWN